MKDDLKDLSPHLETIQDHLDAATEHLEAICQEMVRLERAGMYPSVPHEQWQSRDGGEAKYLYMLFRYGRDGQYVGPDGRRKVYIGCDPDKIAEARRLARNRREYNQLKRLAENLQGWITRKAYEVRYLANSFKDWPRYKALLGPPGAGQQEPGGPNEEGDH